MQPIPSLTIGAQGKLLPARRAVLVVNGDLVVAYNTDTPYPRHITPKPSWSKLDQPVFSSNEVPYLCAVPTSPDWSGALLGRLDIGERDIPIAQMEDKYSLDPSIIDSWLGLEKALEIISQNFLFAAQTMFPLDYYFPPLPSASGFARSFRTRRGVYNAVRNSQRAFLGLVAHVSWGALLHRARAMDMLGIRDRVERAKDDSTRDLMRDLDLGWRDLLSHRFSVHPAWIDAIEQSSLCNFSIPRTGVVIRNPQDWLYSRIIPTLVVSNVPVWMIWGPPGMPVSLVQWPETLKNTIGPSRSELRDVHRLNRDPLSRPEDHKASTTHPTVSNTKPLSISALNQAPPDYLAQSFTESKAGVLLPYNSNKGMNIHDWILRKKDEIAKAECRSIPGRLLDSKQRQDVAAKIQFPAIDGALVYEWKLDSDSRPIRCLVSRDKAMHVWSLYGERQRWYNHASNEWELCRELDPTDVAKHSNSDYTGAGAEDNLSDPDLEQYETPATEEAVTLWRERPVQLVAQDINACLTDPTFLSVLDSNRLLEAKGIVTDAYQLLYMRYGFSYDRNFSYLTVIKPQWSLAKAMRVLGDSRVHPTFSIIENSEAATIQFLMHLAAVGHPDSPTTNIPFCLCDLYPENPKSLLTLRSAVYTQRIDAAGASLYIIRHRNEGNPEWVLAVTDPCTALLAVRANPPSIAEFVLDLLRSRTPFFTFKRETSHVPLGTTVTPPKYKKRRFGLGERPPGHRPDKSDYVVYECEIRRLLDNRRVARAAVKRGGILSRIVRTYVDEYEILQGPSPSARDYPYTLTTTINGETISFYDDNLTEQEISMIVGLYSIKDERGAPTEQSWWPTAGKFDDSGLNVGPWTPNCEEWYERRRTNILAGRCTPCTASAWRDLIKFERETKRTYKGAKQLAARFIDMYYKGTNSVHFSTKQMSTRFSSYALRIRDIR